MSAIYDIWHIRHILKYIIHIADLCSLCTFLLVMPLWSVNQLSKLCPSRALLKKYIKITRWSLGIFCKLYIHRTFLGVSDFSFHLCYWEIVSSFVEICQISADRPWNRNYLKIFWTGKISSNKASGCPRQIDQPRPKL